MSGPGFCDLTGDSPGLSDTGAGIDSPCPDCSRPLDYDGHCEACWEAAGAAVKAACRGCGDGTGDWCADCWRRREHEVARLEAESVCDSDPGM